MEKWNERPFWAKAALISLTFFPTGLWLEANATTDDVRVISQKNRTYAPGELSIKAGETIRIINDDIFLHHAFIDEADLEYDSGPMKEGEMAELTFEKPGQYDVKCAIHPKMRLSVTVE